MPNNPLISEREGERLDIYTDIQNKLRELCENYYAPGMSQDVAVLHCTLDSHLEYAARHLVGSELDAVVGYVETFFGKDAKFYAAKRLKEYTPLQPPIETAKLPTAASNGHGSTAGMSELKAYHCGELIDSYPDMPTEVLKGAFDAGDKVCIISASKSRKSFFALQMALSLAAGREFLGFQPAKPLRVWLCQNEINHCHFHRRVRDVAAALGITSDIIEANLHYTNTRGVDIGVSELTQIPVELKSEVIIFDPLYKMLTGDENSAQDFKPLLAEFDRVAQNLQAAVVYVHHDAKGAPGARLLADRGAGSGVLARDYDAGFFLTPHRDEEETWVLETLLRNYPPVDASSIIWQDGAFHRSDISPVLQTATRRTISNAGKKPAVALYDPALQLLLDGPVTATALRDMLGKRLGIPQAKAREVYKLINDSSEVLIKRDKNNSKLKVIMLTEQGRERLRIGDEYEHARNKVASFLSN